MVRRRGSAPPERGELGDLTLAQPEGHRVADCPQLVEGEAVERRGVRGEARDHEHLHAELLAALEDVRRRRSVRRHVRRLQDSNPVVFILGGERRGKRGEEKKKREERKEEEKKGEILEKRGETRDLQVGAESLGGRVERVGLDAAHYDDTCCLLGE